MPSLQKYISKGRPYWRLVESRRVNGRPTLSVIAHLGTAATLLKRLSQSPAHPIKTRVFSFGGVAALMGMAEELQVASIIDHHVTKRSQGVSVGTYLTLAAINRCLAPCSKNRIGEWYAKTTLPQWLKIPSEALSSQRFWDHMDYVDAEAIQRIEEDLVRRLVDHFHVDPSSLAFDCTNFDTFIDTANPATLPQRGHAKSKRADLRIVGLALLVSRDFHIPLFSQVYPGNRHDSQSFTSALGVLAGRLALFERNCDSITLIFDKGNNSAANQEILEQARYHFVGSLIPTHYSDLLEIPLKQFVDLEGPRFEGTKVFRTTHNVWEVPRTVIVTWSKTLFEKQIRGIVQELGKKRRLLHALSVKLWRSQQQGARGKGYTPSSLSRQVGKILSGQHMKQLLTVTISKGGGHLRISCQTRAREFNRLKNVVLGKRILFTDQDGWSSEAIVGAYRGQSDVESAFRRMKNPFFVSWSPMWHWTDSKIRVHALYSLLALTLCALLQRKLHQEGIAISPDQMFRELNDIGEVHSFYLTSPTGRPRSTRLLTELNETQHRLFRCLNLGYPHPKA